MPPFRGEYTRRALERRRGGQRIECGGLIPAGLGARILQAREAEAEAETEAEPEAESEPEAETEPEAEAETESESETEPETESEAESEAESESESETEPETESEAEAEFETELGGLGLFCFFRQTDCVLSGCSRAWCEHPERTQSV